MNSNTKKKLSVISIIAGALVLIGLAAIFFLINSSDEEKELQYNSNLIAFYGISESDQNSITENVEAFLKQNNIEYQIVTLDSKDSLENQLSALPELPCLLFTYNGASLTVAKKLVYKESAFADQTEKIAEYLADMSNSIKNTSTYSDSGKLIGIPVLSSHFEIDFERTSLTASKEINLSNWDYIEKFNRQLKSNDFYPVVFEGKNPAMLLDLIGALTEALDGIEEYNNAAVILNQTSSKDFDPVKTANLLCSDHSGPVFNAVRLLNKWYKDKIIYPDTFSLTAKDINNFMESNLVTTSFMSLNTHRKIGHKAIRKFESSYFPSKISANNRSFTAPVVQAVLLNTNPDFNELVKFMLQPAQQEDLSRKTGLAPVNKNCRTPDAQASDARYWVAATNTPVPGLSREADLTQDQLTSLAAELIGKIKY